MCCIRKANEFLKLKSDSDVEQLQCCSYMYSKEQTLSVPSQI